MPRRDATPGEDCPDCRVDLGPAERLIASRKAVAVAAVIDTGSADLAFALLVSNPSTPVRKGRR